MRILYHITGAITFVNEIPWVAEPIYLAQVCSIDLQDMFLQNSFRYRELKISRLALELTICVCVCVCGPIQLI